MFRVKNKPLLCIEPEQFLPDELYLLMRIGDILLRNLIDDAKDRDDEAEVSGQVQGCLNTLYKNLGIVG